MIASIPISLYVHLPWCVSKCPYCDFNSHAVVAELDERAYIDALLTDLEADLERAAGRSLRSIFIGGGTPSLFSGSSIDRLLQGIRARIQCSAEAEITLEANPGTVDAEHFAAYRQAGVNRLSIGVQSFDDGLLREIGRIHTGSEALAAVRTATDAGFTNLNLDLMFGLPRQSLSTALADVRTALELKPPHISYYQLTLEPNTRFSSSAPQLPDEDLVWDMQMQAQDYFARAGLSQYEVSAYASAGNRCRHNLNYWEFGDYLGIGAGAHGKTTVGISPLIVERYAKAKHPREYLRRSESLACNSHTRKLGDNELIVEFMLNALRLTDGFSLELFATRTGLPIEYLQNGLRTARERGMIESSRDWVSTTSLGKRFLNELINLF